MDFELTDEQEREMRAELEAARREWEAEHPRPLSDGLTDGVPNEWDVDYGEIENGTWERFRGDNVTPRSVGAALRDAEGAPGDGDRGLDKRQVLVRILSILREAKYPLHKKEVAERLASWLNGDVVSESSLKRYLNILCDLDFVRRHGDNRSTVYVAGGAKRLRSHGPSTDT